MKRKKKRYGVKTLLRSSGFLVPKKLSDEEEERDDEIGQPDEKGTNVTST